MSSMENTNSSMEELATIQAPRILLVIDNTSSMRTVFNSTVRALQETIAVAQLTQPGLQAAILFYGDYDSEEKAGEEVIEFVPWTTNISTLISRLLSKELTWGADNAEAVKTAMHYALEEADKNDLVLHFTDAPPHHPWTVDSSRAWDNYPKEKEFLEKKGVSHDWVKICRMFHERGITVFTICLSDNRFTQECMVALGRCLPAGRNASRDTITRMTMALILKAMGIAYDGEGIEESSFSASFHESKVSDETDTTGGFFSKKGLVSKVRGMLKSKVTIQKKPLGVEVYPSMETSMQKCLQKLDSDPVYRQVVFQTLETLFEPDRVLALTYNGLFGKMWRHICKSSRADPYQTLLADKLSRCCQNMPTPEEEAKLREWIEDSYDFSSEVAARLDDIKEPYPCLVLNIPENHYLSRKAMQNIARASCSSEDLQTVQTFLSQIEIAHGPVKGRNETSPKGEETKEGALGSAATTTAFDRPKGHYIPLCLSDKEVFSLLGHLMCPGTLLSMRPGNILAMIAITSQNAILAKRAEALLEATCGSWVHLDEPELYPESYTYHFVRLASKLPGHLLTDEERTRFKQLQALARVKMNGKKQFTVKVGYTPNRKSPTFDTFRRCHRCNMEQPLSLMTMTKHSGEMEEEVCASCLWELNSSSFATDDVRDESKSLLERCHTCKCIYTVIAPHKAVDAFMALPKCHYCRMKTGLQIPTGADEEEFKYGGPDTPFITCSSCENKFVCPLKDTVKLPFNCAVCEHAPHLAVRDCVVTFKELVEENPFLLTLLGISSGSVEAVFCPTSLFKLRDRVRFEESEGANRTDGAGSGNPAFRITTGGLMVLNSGHVCEEIVTEVTSGATTATCDFCFDQVPLGGLDTACGKCNHFLCTACLSRWYGQPSPGCIVLPPHLQCPFCKQVPLWSVMKRYNKRLANVMSGGDDPFDTEWYVAWCTSCSTLKRHSERVCAQGVPEVDNFCCLRCRCDDAPVYVKNCPGCGVSTEKASGCSHITCPIETCGSHWCWECVGLFDADTIYEHMLEVHNGYGFT